MCGLFGAIAAEGQLLSAADVAIFKRNAKLARRRGSDASGLVALGEGAQIRYLKSWLPVTELMATNAARSLLVASNQGLFGHSRLETHGFSAEDRNNQPMTSKNWFVLHNGIVTNHSDVRLRWSCQHIGEDSDSDSFAILLALEHWYESRSTRNLAEVLGQLEGELTVVAGSVSGDVFVYTNVGNLYIATAPSGTMMFASEARQLPRGVGDIVQVGHGLTILRDGSAEVEGSVSLVPLSISQRGNNGALGLHLDVEHIPEEFDELVHELDARANRAAAELRRCTSCILPDTFPNITFDDSGMCSVCASFSPPTFAGIDVLRQEIHRSSPDGRRVLVCLSGGRDSCYVLHLIHEMGFEPVAYTYDWGMVTTAARENMARMCGKLGVEHILVSPNIQKNRDRVRHALLNWLRRPDLATLPILMAGDKPYFRFAQVVSEERGGIPAIMADHHLETTGFKSMLAGARPSPNSSGGVEYRLSKSSLARMALRYGRSAFMNPPMMRSVLTEGAIGFVDYYLRDHTFIRPFMFIPWNETVIEETLFEDYGWSKGSDESLPAWRMGDATAPFYNLIYKLKLGMTEHDALRSNQIRYGLITREEALRSIDTDNAANSLGLAGYFATAGLSPQQSIDALRQLAKRF